MGGRKKVFKSRKLPGGYRWKINQGLDLRKTVLARRNEEGASGLDITGKQNSKKKRKERCRGRRSNARSNILRKKGKRA